LAESFERLPEATLPRICAPPAAYQKVAATGLAFLRKMVWAHPRDDMA